MKVLGLTVAAFVLGLAAAANAATVSQTFTFTGNGTSTQNSFVMTEGDLTLTLGASFYNTPITEGDELNTTDPLKLTRSNGAGLYIDSKHDNDHRIDGFVNEIVTFAFNKAVRITNVTFGYILNDSVFDLFVDSLDDDKDLSPLYNGSQTVLPSFDTLTDTSSLFAIGASAHTEKWVCSGGNKRRNIPPKCGYVLTSYSGFKITSLTVEYDEPVTTVPLPAGGMLLLGGMGALAVLRRRKPL